MGRHPRVPGVVAAVMRESDRHAWTLGQLEEALADRGDAADFSSIFRAVGRLEDDGLVDRVEVAGGQARFELGGRHHDHLYCTGCGDLAPLPCQVVQDTLAGVEQATGFTVAGHCLLVTGTCRACRARPGRAAGPAATRRAGR